MTSPLWQKLKKTKDPLDEESKSVGLKLNIQKTKIVSSGPITSWQIDGKRWLSLFFGAPKSLQMVTAAMNFLLWKKTYD